MNSILDNLRLVFDDVKNYIKNVVLKKRFIIIIAFEIIISFCFSLTNNTLSIDDFAREYYIGDKNMMISSYRWGMVIWHSLFSSIDMIPMIDDLFGLLFMVITCIVICSIFYDIDDNKKDINKYIMFTCLYCSYPLICEVWEYTGCSLNIYGGTIFVSLALSYLIKSEFTINDCFVAGILMLPAAASYESSICVYVTLVLLVWLFKNRVKKEWKSPICLIKFYLPLFVTIFLKYIIGYCLIKILELDQSNKAGSIGINYFSIGIYASLKEVLNNFWYYIVRGFSYFPIGEFVLSLVLFVSYLFSCKKEYNIKIMLVFILTIGSLFSLSFIQGTDLKYRNAQTIQLFIAFVFFEFNNVIKNKKAFFLLMLFLCNKQSIYTSKMLFLNNLRSENECSILRNIGYEIYTKTDKTKKIIFCGEYDLGDYIESRITIRRGSFADTIENRIRKICNHEERLYYNEYVRTNVNSVINWSTKAFHGQSLIKKQMSYLGYDINVYEHFPTLDESYLIKYVELAEESNMNPLEVREFDEFVLVYLGPIKNNVYY